MPGKLLQAYKVLSSFAPSSSVRVCENIGPQQLFLRSTRMRLLLPGLNIYPTLSRMFAELREQNKALEKAYNWLGESLEMLVQVCWSFERLCKVDKVAMISQRFALIASDCPGLSTYSGNHGWRLQWQIEMRREIWQQLQALLLWAGELKCFSRKLLGRDKQLYCCRVEEGCMG